MREAILYEKLTDNKVKCLACSWYCKINAGQVGICATRLNKNGNLYSLVYGKAIGLYLDPVEKKPLYHFLPGSRIFSFGTAGCNFGCLFCQNWEMSQTIKNYQLRVKNLEKNIVNIIEQMSTTITPRKIISMTVEQGARGIAYTYNEPAIFVEFAHDTARLAKKRGLKNIYVSNGFESTEAFNYIKDYLDAINIDLKSFRSEFYQKISKSKIEPVLNNIKKFFQSGIETELTTLIIPGYNDSQGELSATANFIVNVSKDIPWHISAFYPAYQMLNVSPTPRKTLIGAYEIGKKAGLHYVYVGNVLDSKRSATFCPNCNRLLVGRDGYYIDVRGLDLDKGRCRGCQEKIYGVWK